MTSDASQPPPDSSERRRATDAAALKFRESEIKAMARQRAALVDADIETIDMDGNLPRGNVDDGPAKAAASTPVNRPLTAEQRKIRLQLVVFKHSLETFAVSNSLARVGISDIKRGDVIAIDTIVGRIYLQIIDRIKGVRQDSGEILCECHYDLPDQHVSKHAASIQLPICTRNFVITNPDGSTRLASRKLKMSTDTVLPPHVSNLLDERFFAGLAIYASPQADNARPIDLARWVIRMGLKAKALIDENNRREKEKRAQK